MKNVMITVIVWMTSLLAQERTVGLIYSSTVAADGYTLFAPMQSSTTYLINNAGLLVHQWQSTLMPGHSVYLLENGNLLRTEMTKNRKFNGGGSGGRVKEMSWDGSTLWQYDYSSTTCLQHHDVEYLPNGNILMIAWEVKTQTEAISAGRNPKLLIQNELWPDHLVEVQPTSDHSGQIVWEWHAWDHLIQDYDATRANYGVVADHPERIDLNYTQNGPNGGIADWLHINSVDYNTELDQIVLSVHNFSEVWIIDHSTTTAEAAGHTGGRYGKGGDLLYRFGNPQAFDHGSGADQLLFAQHDAHWIPPGLNGAGNLLVFNNGTPNSTHDYSSVDEYLLPVDESGFYSLLVDGKYAAPTRSWSYTAPSPQDFYATNISGAQRLPNGNTLICNGPYGEFFEVDPAGATVWRYINPVTQFGPLMQGEIVDGGRLNKSNHVFRCTRYAPDDAAFIDKDLTPGSPIERYPSVVEETGCPATFQLGNYPNPFNPQTSIHFSLPYTTHVRLEIYNTAGQSVALLVNETLPGGQHHVQWHANDFSGGVYTCRLTIDKFSTARNMILLR
ncbi:T9SS C-terminal target domain-containing protein [candidate division KSB1 bacterium]|nr:aryl-sulfate sulfotransferase [candidate division KSB1 bacterium]RQW04760.1 MAG: T9SS C-terminal target domain-containing protein [candidate division KSB1 bacterium]